ncbi:MAG: DNA primase [Patescibacteria group bacterium]|nr:DNA primase [Patescibacteria group bacterium]
MATDQVQEIKEKIDIVDFVSRYLNLEKAGKNYKTLCPFHEEKTPSFMVSPELQMYKCFGCGKAGDVYNFLMEMEGVDFGEALKTLADQAGVELKDYKPSPKEGRKEKILRINQLAQEFFHYLLTEHDVGTAALNYVRGERELPNEIIEDFKLGYAPQSWESLGRFLLSKGFTLSEIVESGLVIRKDTGRKFYDRFRGRLMFPLHNYRGDVVGFSGRALKEETGPKYMNTPESLVFSKSRYLYGLFQSKKFIRESGKALVVEGPIDLLMPYSRGTKNIVASQGTALTPGQIGLFKRYADSISICFDTDLAGNAATRRGIELAEKEGLDVSVVVLPPKYKDPDDCARQAPSEWSRLVEQPVAVYDFYIQKALQKYDQKTPEGKKKVAAEVLPVLKDIFDDIQRAAYVQKLASELEMGLEVVEQALAKAPSARSEDYKNRSESDLEPYFEQREYPSKEFYMLALILRAPKDRAEAFTHRLGREDFSHPRLRTFFERLKSYHRDNEDFILKGFRAKIEQDSELLELLEDLVLQDFNFALEDLDDELEVGLHKLKQEKIRRKIKKLGKEIAVAEEAGEYDKIEKLQEKLSKYSRKLQ